MAPTPNRAPPDFWVRHQGVRKVEPRLGPPPGFKGCTLGFPLLVPTVSHTHAKAVNTLAKEPTKGLRLESADEVNCTLMRALWHPNVNPKAD